MKIISVVGARPQFIKHAPLSKVLAKAHQCKLIHTGQHYDYNMSKVFFDELGIPKPDFELEVGSGTHAYQTGMILIRIEEILMKENPDLVLIYGDTNSTLAGAISSAKLHIKIAHVEAGVRLFDKSSPEEINRQVADYCADYLFCPTQTAVDNLKHEGITQGVYLTGDVMVDAINLNKKIAEKSNILDLLHLNNKQYVLVTLHRPLNTDTQDRLEKIINILINLQELGETIVFPIHPRTEKMLTAFGDIKSLKKKVKLIEPLGYIEFLKLQNHAKTIITDSGGIQKEAYILKVPCITLMDNTPWVETVLDGWNILVGDDEVKILDAVKNFHPSDRKHSERFGKGNASTIIKNILA